MVDGYVMSTCVCVCGVRGVCLVCAYVCECGMGRDVAWQNLGQFKPLKLSEEDGL